MYRSSVEERLVEAGVIGIAGLLPVALVVDVVGQLDLRHPFDPFVAPFIFRH